MSQSLQSNLNKNKFTNPTDADVMNIKSKQSKLKPLNHPGQEVEK